MSTSNDGRWARIASNFRGQPTSVEQTMFDGRSAVASFAYDAEGRMTRSRRPHWTASGGSALDDPTVTRDYDGLGRVVREVSPRGQRSFYYDTPVGGGRLVRVTDEEGVIHQTVYDGSGRLRAASNVTPGADDERVEYDYGPFSRLSSVRRHGLQTHFEYDERSLVTRYVSPDDEVSRIEYNAFGEVTETESPARGTLSLRYDVLGRLERQTSPDGDTVFRYDEGEFGVGHLTSTMSEDGVASVHTYTAAGQLASDVAVINGDVLEVTFEYDEVGRVREQHFPDSAPGSAFLVGYHYNAAGYLDTLSGPSGSTLYAVSAANEVGQPTEVALGAGLVEYGWDIDEGELDSISFSQAGLDRFRYDYQYNRSGQVTERESTFGPELRRDEFQYDRNRRLSSWSQAWGEEHNTGFHTADYDDYGNLTRLRHYVFTVGGSGFSPHQVSAISGDDRMRYDADGRLVQRQDHTFDYTHFDLPRRITAFGSSTDFQYDAGGRRARRSNTGGQTVYLGEAYERFTAADGSQRHTYHVAGLLDVVREEQSPGAPYTERHLYRHADPVGSVVAVTDAAGNVVERRDYAPFGDTDDGAHGVLRTFAGHPVDDDGIVFMRGRVYDPVSMRFMTPDPIVADPTLGDDFNPYRYVRNDPATQDDPSGFGPAASPVPEADYHTTTAVPGFTAHRFYHDQGTAGGRRAAAGGESGSENGQPTAGAASGSSSTQASTQRPSLSMSLDPRAPGGAVLLSQDGTPLDGGPEVGNSVRETNGGPIDRGGGRRGSLGGSSGGMHWYDHISSAHDGTLAQISNFAAGFGDTVSFGVSRLLRSIGDDPVDTDSTAYNLGMGTALVLDIALTGGSMALRSSAARAMPRITARTRIAYVPGSQAARNAMASQARRLARSIAGGPPGTQVHHINTLFGHTVRGRSYRSFWPSAGLPSWLHNASRNLTPLTRSAHELAHRQAWIAERMLRALYNPAASMLRAGGVSAELAVESE